MAKLKLGPLLDDKPVKITVDLPADVHRDLVAYAEALGKETGQPVADPARLVPVMIERFMASDRAFTKSSRRPDR
ncbi:MAG: small protein [Asticcacaulis sp. 32-58-5]|nr:MAG: small protein [Asticcacaulis sp. 32-58-5]